MFTAVHRVEVVVHRSMHYGAAMPTEGVFRGTVIRHRGTGRTRVRLRLLVERRMPSNVILAVGVLVGGFLCCSCSSGSGSNPLSAVTPVSAVVQQDSTNQTHQGTVACGIVQTAGPTVWSLLAHGSVTVIGASPVFVSPHVTVENSEGQTLITGTPNPGDAVSPGHSWSWIVAQNSRRPPGITDTRAVRCVTTITVTPETS